LKRIINLNADMGEGFGAYDIGDDAGMLETVTSANIACGFHAGDPSVMRRVVERAKAAGVSIGAHPGFADLQGFGRRRIDLSPTEIENMVAYQTGALCAVAALAGAQVTHLKPHGALSNMAAVDAEYAAAIARAIRAVDARLIFLAIAGSEMEKAGRALGLSVAREGFCDRQYEDGGTLASRKIPGTVYRDPETAVAQVLDMIEGRIRARSGAIIACDVDSLCIHGDEPSGTAIARAVRAALAAKGIAIVPLPQMALS
jgi:UPF0271 protein